jgi:Ca-activated chloride channel family protein
VSALGIDGLHFLRPLWLLGLLALPLLAWGWHSRRGQQSVWREAVDPHLLPHLLDARASRHSRTGGWLALIGLALACVAMAGPSWRRVEQPLWQTRAPLVVALDLSSATLAGDLPPSRLAQARAKIAQLLKHRQGGQVALVAYAEDAYTVAPLTDDVANIALFLDALDPDVMPEDGNRAGRAIAWSQRLLRQAGFERGDILLLTGGTDADARDSAAQAATAGYRVSVLGLGSATGAAFRRPDGSIGQTRLDPRPLQAVASAGGGAYQALRADSGDLDALGVLDPAQAGARSAQGEKQATWLDEGYWLLPPLLLLAALAFRRGGVLAVVALCLCMPVLPAHAQDDAANGSGLWRRPDQQAYVRMQQGQQAYRKEDFAAAARAFADVDSSDGAYNLGNALARQGRYEEAIAAYDRALAGRPGMEDAVANRKAVEAAMKRKPPQGANKNQPNPRQSQPGQSQSRPGSQGDPGQSGEDAQQARKPPPQDSRQEGKAGADSPSEQPTQDPAQQRAADAAQRQRMQRALEQQKQTDSGQDVKGKPDRAEQAAQRERSIANEAWLRRVPDDPGALLRAKFQLEYERRQARGED